MALESSTVIAVQSLFISFSWEKSVAQNDRQLPLKPTICYMSQV